MRIDAPREYVVKNIRYALAPASVAVVGASDNPGKVGFQVIHGLRRYRYSGKIYPVNSHADTIQGLRAYRELKDVPDTIDLLFVCIKRDQVASVLQQAVEKKVRVAAVATSDFKETGQGDLQDKITHFCRSHQLPLLGPNLLGLGNPHLNFSCGFIPFLPEKGPVAMISQSGANLLGAMGASQLRNYGLSFFVGLGNKADIDFSELMAYAKQDPNTKSIAVYIEGLDSPKRSSAPANRSPRTSQSLSSKPGDLDQGPKQHFVTQHPTTQGRTMRNLTESSSKLARSDSKPGRSFWMFPWL